MAGSGLIPSLGPDRGVGQGGGRLVLSLPVIAALACGGALPPHTVDGGVVAAATPEAVAAGVAVLEAGGNAVDAAVAVSFVLGVTEPAMSGLGGQTQMLIARPGRDPIVINGTSFAPRNTPVDAQATDLIGHRATTIPTTVRALDFAYRHHGSGRVSWSDLLAPAIRQAADGFVVGSFRHRVWLRHADDLRRNAVTRGLFLTEGGLVPGEGQVFRQPVLAATLRRLARLGGEDFYTGEIARLIAADMAAQGGWITLADLNGVTEPKELRPLVGSYREWEVYTLPPPGGGWVVLQMLNVLELSPARDLAPGTATRLVRIAEALRVGHRSRRDQPVTDLVDYGREVRERIDKEHAAELRRRDRGSGETTHFSVVDASGMIVSVTASINAYFGARAASPELGFLYNDYMHEFELGRPGHPFALRAGAMPYSSMSPTVLARRGRPMLGLGSPGSARIISAVVQVIQAWVDDGASITAAVAAPRIHVVPDSSLYLETASLSPAALRALETAGFRFVAPPDDLVLAGRNAYFGGVHAVAFENGAWEGAADLRRDGTVGRALLRRQEEPPWPAPAWH